MDITGDVLIIPVLKTALSFNLTRFRESSCNVIGFSVYLHRLFKAESLIFYGFPAIMANFTVLSTFLNV